MNYVPPLKNKNLRCYFCNNKTIRSNIINEIQETFNVNISKIEYENVEFRFICCECFKKIAKELNLKICIKCKSMPVFDENSKYCFKCLNSILSWEYEKEIYGKDAPITYQIRNSGPEQFEIYTPIIMIILSYKEKYKFTNDRRRLQYKTKPQCCDTYITPYISMFLKRRNNRKYLYVKAICYNSKEVEKLINCTDKSHVEIIKSIQSLIHIHGFFL